MRIIRPLEKADTEQGFTCGVQQIDDFLAKRAWAQHRNHLGSRVRVLVDSGSGEVLGVYALSVKHIERARLDGVVPRPAPPHPLGVFYIGYFGVALGHQGRGLGRELKRDALMRCVAGAEDLGAVGVLLDSLDARSTRFYRALGFKRIPRSPRPAEAGSEPLFISMRTVLASLP
jgi:GNAT superfamily N-acetyltransferase